MNKSTVIKKKRGRPKYTPTPDVRQKIEAMTTAGLREEVMARILDISRNTLRQYYALELETGRDKALAGNTVALMNAARKGNVTAMIYLQKCLGGNEWKEKQEIKHDIDAVEICIRKITPDMIEDPPTPLEEVIEPVAQ
jgi:N-acetylglucosamine kinase-like BadF-type ATPase